MSKARLGSIQMAMGQQMGEFRGIRRAGVQRTGAGRHGVEEASEALV